LQWARGAVLHLLTECARYEVPNFDPVPFVDVAGTFDEAGGKVALFLLNRDLSKSRTVELQWQDRAPARVISSWLLTGDDLKASNTFTAPQRVAPQTFSVPPTKGSRTGLELPARSYATIQWALA
jgi:alpha-N-arabinofuranosidase